MSQSRISYSRVLFVGAVFFAIAYSGFVVGRSVPPVMQSRSHEASLTAPSNVASSPNSFALALQNLVTIVPMSLASFDDRDWVLNRVKSYRADGADKTRRFKLALRNAITIVPEIRKPLPLSTVIKSDFSPVDISVERRKLALRNALTIIPNMKNLDRVVAVEKTESSIGIIEVGVGVNGQNEIPLPLFAHSIASSVVPPRPQFNSLDERLWSKFGQPVWYVRPGDFGLPIAREDLASKKNVESFFGGLTEREFRTREVRCLAKAIYHEARGESQKGQFAVAQTIMNRVRAEFFPDTICGVIYENSHRKNKCQFSFACDGISDKPKDLKLWDVAQKNARQVVDGKVWLDDIGYASHYHATYVRPNWRKYMNRIKRIGIHIFYRAKFLSLPEELALRSPKNLKTAN